jgi:hypothetical protein
MSDHMKKLPTLTAVGEAALGRVPLVYPPVVVRLSFNAGLGGTGLVMGRVEGSTGDPGEQDA